MDDLEEAWRITREIAKDAKEKNTWEPGSYYLCEVHWKRKHEANQVSVVMARKLAEPQG
jgi:YHS domain-containing protein